MTDIASLGIRVQTTGAKEAKADLDQLTTSGAKAEQSIKKVAPAFDKAGVSAKQLQFATRGLPAQFTDIATSLGSGQRPLQVLLQQGGQIKDMFGGIGPAIRAVGGYVAGLINPFTLAAAAVVGLGLAWKSAADEAQAFNLAIIQTGQFSGNTTEDLQRLADKLDKTTQATGRFAADVLAKVEATGRFTGQQVEVVSTAIVNMAKATQLAGGDVDEAVKSLIKNFTDLSKDPVEALLKLNESQHFLERSTLDQVEALIKQGDEAGAAELAIKAMADTLNTRAPEMVRNVNSATAVFESLRSKIAETADEAVSFFRRADVGLQEFIRNHQAAVGALAKLQSIPILPFGGSQSKITQSLLDHASRPLEPVMIGFKNPTVDSAAERKRIQELKDAQNEWNSSIRQGETTAQRLKRELDEAEAAGKRLGKTGAEIAAAQDAIRAAFAARAPKGKKPKKENTRGIENASDRFDDMVGSLRAEMEGPLQRAEEQHLKRMREIEQAARDGKRSHDDLAAALKLEGEAYAKTRMEIEQRIDAEVASLSGPLASAQSQHEQALRRIEELQKSGRVSGDEYNAMLAEEADRHDEAMRAAQRQADPLGALLSDMREEIDVIGKSNAERAVMNVLRQEGIDIMSAEGQAALATAKAFEKEAEAKANSIALMDEWRNDVGDALADFATGAKSAKDAALDFFDSFIEAAIRAATNKAVTDFFGAFGSDGSGSTGGGWLAKLAGMITGSGSSASSGFTSPFAKGGAFDNGQVMAFANGGVVNSPTMFRMGLMGEAGPEAILPLHRGPDGKLGVRMEAANEGRRGDVIQHNTYNVMGSMDRRAREASRYDNARNLNRAQRRNG